MTAHSSSSRPPDAIEARKPAGRDRRKVRIAIRVARPFARRVAWFLSVVLAGWAGWQLARYDDGDRVAGRAVEPAAAPTGLERTGHEPPGLAPSALPGVRPPDRQTAEPPPPAAEPVPDPDLTAVRPPKKRPAETEREPAAPIEPPQAAVEPEPAVAVEPPAGALTRARSADRLAESEELERAKQEARALIADHASYTALAAALVDDGAGEIAAELIALRVLQVAGEEATSREVAREMKRSHAGSPEVVESIRRWGVLNPLITSSTPSIEGGRHVVVHGTLENPDVADVRRVRVRIEALDAGGQLLDRTEVRVRPNVLAPGSTGEFKAAFKKLDPASVLRTRATVIEWESEVLTPDRRELARDVGVPAAQDSAD